MKRALRLTAVAVAAAFLAGCASVSIDDALKETNTNAQQFTGGKLELSRTQEQRDRRATPSACTSQGTIETPRRFKAPSRLASVPRVRCCLTRGIRGAPLRFTADVR